MDQELAEKIVYALVKDMPIADARTKMGALLEERKTFNKARLDELDAQLDQAVPLIRLTPKFLGLKALARVVAEPLLRQRFRAEDGDAIILLEKRLKAVACLTSAEKGDFIRDNDDEKGERDFILAINIGHKKPELGTLDMALKQVLYSDFDSEAVGNASVLDRVNNLKNSKFQWVDVKRLSVTGYVDDYALPLHRGDLDTIEALQKKYEGQAVEDEEAIRGVLAVVSKVESPVHMKPFFIGAAEVGAEGIAAGQHAQEVLEAREAAVREAFKDAFADAQRLSLVGDEIGAIDALLAAHERAKRIGEGRGNTGRGRD